VKGLSFHFHVTKGGNQVKPFGFPNFKKRGALIKFGLFSPHGNDLLLELVPLKTLYLWKGDYPFRLETYSVRALNASLGKGLGHFRVLAKDVPLAPKSGVSLLGGKILPFFKRYAKNPLCACETKFSLFKGGLTVSVIPQASGDALVGKPTGLYFRPVALLRAQLCLVWGQQNIG